MQSPFASKFFHMLPLVLLCVCWLQGASSTSNLNRSPVESYDASRRDADQHRRLDFTPLGLQSGPDAGPSWASAVTVQNGALWVVGSTQGNWFQEHTPQTQVSGCFLAQIDTPTSTNYAQWSTRLTLDNPDVVEDCTNMLWLSKTRLVLSGHAEPGGVLEGLYDPAGYTVVDHFGTLLDMNVDGDNATLLGGDLFEQVTAAYPMALTKDASDPPLLYVISMESDKVTKDDTQSKSIPLDWHAMNDPMRFFVTGMSFNLVVTKVKVYNPADLSSSNNEDVVDSLTDAWRMNYATQNGKAVHTAGIERLRLGTSEVLVVAGTTAGHGNVFGSNSSGTDLDGFVTRLSSSTGRLESTPLSRRINSLNGADDWIGGLCVHGGDIYVVGSTRGDMVPSSVPNTGIDAFLMKLDATTLQTVWTYQLGAKPRSSSDGPATATGVSCAVTPDGGKVYMAGVVENGAVLDLSGTTSSYGDDDVYVVQLDADFGKMTFVRQLGSEANDEVAFRNGLTVDSDGNAILVGTTFGSFYRQRDPLEGAASDVFVATISVFNGVIANPMVHPEFGNDNGSGTETPSSSDADTQANETKKGVGISMFVLLFISALIIVYCCYFARREKSAVVETDRSKVLRYLSKFDVEDVDLKHSATGGWHCSYAGPLAKGVDNKVLSRQRHQMEHVTADGREASSGEDLLLAPLTGTAGILEDSLYVQEDEQMSAGTAESGVNGRRNQYYSSSLLDHGWEAERVSGIVDQAVQRNRKGGWGRDIV